jgi:hypothetical protein
MASLEENRIMIYGPQTDGTYVVEFRPLARRLRSLSREASPPCVKHFQARMRLTGSWCQTPSLTNKNQGGGSLSPPRRAIIRAGIGRFKLAS